MVLIVILINKEEKRAKELGNPDSYLIIWLLIEMNQIYMVKAIMEFCKIS